MGSVLQAEAEKRIKLAFIYIIIMPLEEFGGWLVGEVGGEADGAAVVAVVVAAVIELLFDATADFDMHVRGDGDVALVEQGVKIAAEEEPIADEVLAAFRIGLNVRGIERGEGFLAGNGTASLVGVCDQHAE